MRLDKATYFAELKNCMITAKNVPCMKRAQCGEDLYSSGIIKQLEDLLDNAEKLARELMIVDFPHKAA